MRDYQIISADSHVVEPPDLWDKWLERKYRETAPRLVDDGEGGDAWLYLGGKVPEPLGLVTCVGTRPEDLKWTGKKYGVNMQLSTEQSGAMGLTTTPVPNTTVGGVNTGGVLASGTGGTIGASAWTTPTCKAGRAPS